MTRYQIVVGCILFASFFTAFIIVTMSWLFPENIDDNEEAVGDVPNVPKNLLPYRVTNTTRRMK